MERLFVYGSLKRGFSNAGKLEGARFRGIAKTSPGYFLVRYLGDYPALVRAVVPSPADTLHRVQGELYEVTRQSLALLDAFEEVPAVYQRVLVELDSGEEVFAYVIDAREAERWERVPDENWVEPIRGGGPRPE